MDPTCVFNFFTFFERILYKSNCIIFIFSWCGTHTKIRSKLFVIVTAGSQKNSLWGPQRTPLGILRVNFGTRWWWGGQLHVMDSPGNVPSITHWIRGCVGPRLCMIILEKRRIFCPCRESNHDFGSVQPVAKSLYWLRCPGAEIGKT